MPALTVTPRAVVRGALLSAHVIDREKAITGTELNDGLQLLNEMLASWGTSVLKQPAIIKESFALTLDQGSYSIGETSADLSTVRPVKILSAFLRDGGNVDYPLEIVGRDRYNETIVKGQSYRPTELYYNPTSPNGTIYFNSVSQGDTLFIDSQKTLGNFTDPDAEISLPDNYSELMRYQLAIRMAAEYETTVTPEVAALASSLMSDAQVNNSEPFEAELDFALANHSHQYSDHELI